MNKSDVVRQLAETQGIELNDIPLLKSTTDWSQATTTVKKTINYVVTTKGWSGKKVTECETEGEAWEALGDCSFGALTEVSSPTGKDVIQFVPY